MRVRSLSFTTRDSRACSSGAKMLTLPAEGLIVPKNAIGSTIARPPAAAKARPVAMVRPQAPISRARWSNRAPTKPIPSVVSAEPSSASVATTPISKAPSPVATRYAGSNTAAKPSPKSRRARAA